MITKDLLDYFKSELASYSFEGFYDSLRDDKKEKSFSIYELGNQKETQTIGSQEFYTLDFQLQIVYTQSKSECEKIVREIYRNYILLNSNKHRINDTEFYILPLLNRKPIYLGTLGNGCHKYGIDVLVYSSN